MDMMSYLMGRNSGSAKKGAKIEVVTELPETGEANVIYLVPKQDEDENNVFDEYIWINDDWELIGTTDIDLSGYQPLLTAGEGINITNDTISSAMPVYLITDNSSSNPFVLENCNRGIYLFGTTESIYLKGTATAIAKNIFMYGGFIAITAEDTTIDPLSNSWKTMGYIYGAGYDSRNAPANGTDFSISNTAIQVWQPNGGISINNSYKTQPIIDPRYSATIKGTHTYTVLPQSSVVPTSDNQLVNKKYVDDSIAAAGGGSDLPIYVLNTTNELNDDRNTQQFGDDEKTQMSTILTDAYAKGYNNIAILLCSTTSARTYMFYSYSTLNNSNGYRFFYTDVTFKNRTDRTKIFWRYFNVDSTWSNNVCTATSMGYNMIDIQYLAKDNYQPYTVTGEYNPAHKLYVDTKVLTTAGLSMYSTSTTYQVGDYVYKGVSNLTVYKCNTADTTGTWDSSKWTQATYMEYLSDTLVGGALNGSY